MKAAVVEFLTPRPPTEPYGRVIVFRNVAGNSWISSALPPLPDLGPRPRPDPVLGPIRANPMADCSARRAQSCL